MTELTDEELLEEAKKKKKSKMYDAGIIGLLIGIGLYSTVFNGFGLLTFLPLAYLPIAARNNTEREKLEKLLKERGLK
ncbi:FUSC family protein [bacterium SCSIO 12741]|nr:FUSC family protein [bacterium SCSIO 12741]